MSKKQSRQEALTLFCDRFYYDDKFYKKIKDCLIDPRINYLSVLLSLLVGQLIQD